jgi:hypothetical protein
MESIKPGATLAVPFNIVPTPKAAFYGLKKIVWFLMHKKDDEFEKREDSDSSFNVINLISAKIIFIFHSIIFC